MAKKKTETAAEGTDPITEATMTNADMVRAAIAAGADTAKPGIAWIKEKYGVDVSAGNFNVTKSNDKKKGGGKTARKPRAAKAAASVTQEPDGKLTFADLDAAKLLLRNLGNAGAKALIDRLS